MFPTLGPFFSLSRPIVAILLEVGIRCRMVCERYFDIQASKHNSLVHIEYIGRQALT